MKENATKTSWQNHPMDNPKQIGIDLHFTEQQLSKLKEGLVPQEMEDRWFIYFEDEWLYFHRSWTGHEIFRAKLDKEAEGFAIKEFWAERNQEKYQNEDDSADIQTFSSLIRIVLAGI